jgi:Tol biopolymer transport system component
MNLRRIALLVLFVICNVAGMMAASLPAHATFPGRNGLIAWTKPGFLIDSEIWVMNPDGTDKHALTDNASNDADPAWSADGSMLAFESVTGNAFNLYVINADGTGLRQLTYSTKHTDVQPAWSPDGTKIAFSRQDMQGRGGIWVVNVDGSSLQRLTCEQNQNSHPNWSPDGSTIVFETDRAGSHDLYFMDADGSNKRPLLSTPDVQEENPNWSPDGTQVAFDSCPSSSYPCPGSADYNIFVVNADGTGLRQITTDPRIDHNPAWSPNGVHLVYRSDASGNTEVWRIRLSTLEAKKLTSGLTGGVDPDWQPLPTG